MLTEQHEEQFEYGAWEYSLDGLLAEERKQNPFRLPPDILPNWGLGVPKRLRRSYWTGEFENGLVKHRAHWFTDTVELDWERPHSFAVLARYYGRLPSAKWSNHWTGVYRIFVQNRPISRLCADDPTGTLYIGMAGAGRGQWSILRTRLRDAANREHHATKPWKSSGVIPECFPWESIMVEWAYTPPRHDFTGRERPSSPIAEGLLIEAYRKTFGERPPLNEKG